ncbi:MAG TPA: hypothetical protein VFA26_24180 [Gemmataceae bacterium]|nr:hypothetical protein [Gemmataceae bacterium]
MTIAAEWPRPADILEYYRRSLEALDALKKALRAEVAPQSRFYGMTPQEAEQAIRELAEELDREVTLLLTASFEATFQVDFHDRVGRRKKDPVSRRLRKLARTPRPKRARWVTVEEILDVWQKETGKAQVIGSLKQLVLYRHWLAHGRYWVQKSGLTDPDPFDAWSRGKAVFDALPGFRPLPAP